IDVTRPATEKFRTLAPLSSSRALAPEDVAQTPDRAVKPVGLSHTYGACFPPEPAVRIDRDFVHFFRTVLRHVRDLPPEERLVHAVRVREVRFVVEGHDGNALDAKAGRGEVLRGAIEARGHYVGEVGGERIACVGTLLAGLPRFTHEGAPSARIAHEDGASAERRHVHREVVARDVAVLLAEVEDLAPERLAEEIDERRR